MAHTIANKGKLILRVKKIKGQLNSIEKALENETDCFKILQQISASRGAIQSLMSEVLDGHIKEHLGNHVSEEHLSRLFKKEMGITLTAYIADLRTKKAAELLKTSMLSVAEIAMYVGYPDSNYFVKVFKKRYGMTPSAYRSY